MKKILILMMLFSVGFVGLKNVNATEYTIEYYYDNIFNNYWDNYHTYVDGTGTDSLEYYWHNTETDPLGSNLLYSSNALNRIAEYLRINSTNSSQFNDNIGRLQYFIENEGMRFNIPYAQRQVSNIGIFDYSLSGSNGVTFPYPNKDYYHEIVGYHNITHIQVEFNNLELAQAFDYSQSALTYGSFKADSVKYTIFGKNILDGSTYIVGERVIEFNVLERERIIDMGFYFTPISSYENLLDWESYTHDVWNLVPDGQNYYYFNGYKNNNRYINDDYMFDFIKENIEPLANNETEYQILLALVKYNMETKGINSTLPQPNLYDISYSVGGQWNKVPSLTFLNNSVLNVKLLNMNFINMSYLSSNGYVSAKYLSLKINGITSTLPYVIDNAEISIKIKPATLNTVVFNTNGGTLMDTQYILDGSYPVVDNTTKTGHTFYGWSDNILANDIENATLPCSGVVNVITTPVFQTIILEDKTYYALWKPKTYVIDVIYNGGRIGNSLTNKNPIYQVCYNDTIKENIDEYVYEHITYRTGYKFQGWYLDEELTISYDPSMPIQQNITIYADWVFIGTSEAPSSVFTFLESIGLNFQKGWLLLYVLVNIGLILVTLKYSSILSWVISVLLTVGFGIFGLLQVSVLLVMSVLLVFVLILFLNGGDRGE